MCFKSDGSGAGETSQPFRALVAPEEDPGLLPSIQVVVHSHPQLQFQGIEGPLLTSVGIKHSHGRHIHADKSTSNVNNKMNNS